MTNSIPGLAKFYALNDALLGAPVGVLVLLACIAIGYAIKCAPLDNKWIPSIVILSGMVLFPVMSQRPSNEPVRIWVTKAIVMGLITAALAWMLHNKILKRLEDHLGWFKEKDENHET